MDSVTVSSTGQLVIPKGLRDSAGLSPGSRLTVWFAEGEIRLRPLPSAPAVALEAVAGCLARPGRNRVSDAQAKALVKARLKAQNAP